MNLRPEDDVVTVVPARYPCRIKDKRAADVIQRLINWVTQQYNNMDDEIAKKVNRQ